MTSVKVTFIVYTDMKKALITKIWVSLVLLGSLMVEYSSLSYAKYWQTEKIEVTGYQIAKRINPTRNGDKFSVLWDTQYGVMEIPVTYATYITSSNDCKHSWRIKLLTAYNGLENTSKLQEAYPFLQRDALHIICWVLSILIGFASLIMIIGFRSNNPWEKALIYGWLPISFLGAILGLIL